MGFSCAGRRDTIVAGYAQMKCPEAEYLRGAYSASAKSYQLAIDALVKVVSASRAEFWSALKVAESAKDDCDEALEAIDLHIIKHQCQLN